MSVIPITVFLSLGLVFLFVALFLREHCHRHFANAERDSLLPLADEQPRVQRTGPAAIVSPELEPASDSGAGGGGLPAEALANGSPRGLRPPSRSCLKEDAGTPLR